MKRLIVALVVCLFTLPAVAMQKWQGYCQTGGQKVSVPGLGQSTTKWMQSYPGCTMTIYDSGTSNLSTIYSDDGVTPKANPFVADSITGLGFFYAANGTYDIQFSGGGIASPFTLSGWSLFNVNALVSITLQDLNNIRFCSGYSGADIGAQCNAAYANFNGSNGVYVIGPGSYSYAADITFPLPSTLMCLGNAELNYTGAGNAVKLGADGLTSLTYKTDPYRVQGCTFTGGSTATYGIYFNKYLTYNIIEDVRFKNWGSTTNWAVFFQSQNWLNVIDKLNCWWDATPNAARNCLRVNGVDVDGTTADNGSSRTIMTNSLIQSLTTAGGHGLWVNGSYSSIGPNVTVAGLDVVLDWQANGTAIGPKFYSETTSNATPYAICYGQPSGSHTTAFLTQLVATNPYANLHNLDFGTTTSFLGPCLAGASGSGLQNFTIRDGEFTEVAGGTKIIVQNDKASQLNNQAYRNLVNDAAVTAAQLHTSGGSISNWGGTDGDIYSVTRPTTVTGYLTVTGKDGSNHIAQFSNPTDTAASITIQSGLSVDQFKSLCFLDKSNASQGCLEANASGTLQLDTPGHSGVQVASGGTVSLGAVADVTNVLGNLNVTGLSGFTGNLVPAAAGTPAIGTTSLPFKELVIGSASGNDVKLTGTFTANRVATFPDASITVAGIDKAQTWTQVQTFSVQFASSVTTGTAPFTVASTTGVTNLNADLLDGFHAGNASTGHAMCWKDATHMGYCSDVVSASGTCTCN